ncbi:MAG: TetR/AcrR family transcriptional regulator [Candidatus Acidiferrum sp.]|jgi:AcrR family transcriptional regulator
MPATVLPARQERSRRSLERLLRAAVEVLDEHGLDGATIPRIAKQAGLTPGAIYRRFPDKDALLREVCLRALEGNYRYARDLLVPEQWKNKSLQEMLECLIGMTLHGHTHHRGLLRAITFFTLEHPDPAFVRKSEELQVQVFRTATELLLTRRSEIRHPDPDRAVPFALMMVGVAARGVLVLPRVSRLVEDAEAKLLLELPTMVLRYLGIAT